MKRIFNALAFALVLPVLTPTAANATDDDDRLLSSMSMQESTMAYYTASVIAYPSVCLTKLSDKMKAMSVGMAAKHGETLMRLVRVKMMEPEIAAGRDQWCGKIAKFIESAEQ